ncbi:MAG: NAD(P)/FAD-dependent oxidoreductase [Treponema sp.]|nr:NAD(P)/FAD-dependent oxidoreductase [Treponema sp.]
MKKEKAKNHNKKKIIIVGAGVAGLTAGIYAMQQGFETVIYEKHTQTGGLCTGWDRQGYHIDGCIHWVTGTKKGSALREIWDNVDALKDVEIIQQDYFDVYECCGEKIYIWRDIEKLKNEFITLAPADKKEIKRFIKDVKAVQKMIVPAESPVNLMTLPQLCKQLWSMRGTFSVLLRYKSMSVQKYSKRFSHPALRRVFEICMPYNYSAAVFIFMVATFTLGNGDIPAGGSLQMANRMTKKFLSLGGIVKTGMLVTQINITKNKATGIEYITQAGEKCVDNANYIISACDVHTTFNVLLKNSYHDSAFVKRFHQPKIYETQSCVLLTFAVEADLTNYPYSLVLECEKYRVGVTDYEKITVRNYVYEPSFAPQGHTVINVLISQGDNDYLFWKSLYFNKAIYKAEKQRLADVIKKRIEERFPELVGKIKLLDALSPMTFQRYCSSYNGAWMAFRIGKGTRNLMHTGKIKGLSNCYLTGQWLQPPGGLPVALTMGKFTIQRICKKEGMNFRF